MNRIRSLIFPILVATCFVLAACSDADWESATSYLPLERGHKSTQETVQADTTAPPAPVAAETAAPNAPVSADTLARSVSAPSPVEAAQDGSAQIKTLASQSSSMPVAPASASEPTINEHCRAVATQRATDGQYMGMDDAAQHEEYERTYADCAAWDAAHRD
jgi:hypothetical protein